jgi:hypothetical protein
VGIEPAARFVAHYDMLGMNALVQRDLPKAWSAIRRLDDDRERILGLTIEILDRDHGFPRKHYIRDQVRSFAFSDTIVMYSVADNDADLRAIIYLCNEIFSRALHRRIPMRRGIAHGTFIVYPERNLFVGPPLVEAYRLGEEGQWLGTVIDEYTAGRAREADLKAGGGDPLIVSWHVPLKAAWYDIRNVINWPASHRKNFMTGLPLSAEVFYAPFEVCFGPFENLRENDRYKYLNTVEFINEMLGAAPPR